MNWREAQLDDLSCIHGEVGIPGNPFNVR